MHFPSGNCGTLRSLKRNLMSEANIVGEHTGGAIGAVTERRISWLTLVIGAAAAIAGLLAGSRLWAVGLMIGAALAWLNFRWLGRAMDALVLASTAQTGAPRARVPVSTYFFAVFRYGLIALSVYVIFDVLNVPLVSMILGLCALGAAAVAASVYEVLHPTKS
jgi:hypothetical protein